MINNQTIKILGIPIINHPFKGMVSTTYGDLGVMTVMSYDIVLPTLPHFQRPPAMLRGARGARAQLGAGRVRRGELAQLVGRQLLQQGVLPGTRIPPVTHTETQKNLYED
jgi:hypothetical protein